jgi:hypothetical protein
LCTGNSEILTGMTVENPLLLAPTDKIEPTNVFGRKFSVGFPSRTDWLDPGSVLLPMIRASTSVVRKK